MTIIYLFFRSREERKLTLSRGESDNINDDIPWLNIHKETIAVSVANDGRSGETQFHGTIPNAIRHLVSRLAAPDVAHSPLL